MRHAVMLACFLAIACSGSAGAGSGGHVLAVERPETRASAALNVTSPAFPPGGTIPLRYSAYGDNRSPPLAWSGLPAAARSLVLMMEDPDATSARPFVHWLAWNLPSSLSGLPEAAVPPGVRQGRNSRGTIGYFGPRPHGSTPHHYHFQLFALDRALALPAGADREHLLAAMNGHVLAKGDLVGLFRQP
jgi:Raf kinase inhibitor-like YbhB/YbcL family protein